MPGDAADTPGGARYWKFAWERIDGLPPIGTLDYQPKGGAFRIFSEGSFIGENTQTFPARKLKQKLLPFGRCVYCDRTRDDRGAPLTLTSEHVVPEFLGGGLELPQASCVKCQTITATFESAIAQEMFDPVRKEYSLVGKEGVININNFMLDIGRETVDRQIVPLAYYPTVLVMPRFFPAPAYSRRPRGAIGLFNFQMFNINADASKLRKYAIGHFSSQAIDLVRFAQLIAKIAHVYFAHLTRSSVGS